MFPFITSLFCVLLEAEIRRNCFTWMIYFELGVFFLVNEFINFGLHIWTSSKFHLWEQCMKYVNCLNLQGMLPSYRQLKNCVVVNVPFISQLFTKVVMMNQSYK
eukprot:TRINITY_DN3035_c0_g2_i2.p3 TRINITY_DN3035_c0_g2~~TRINITY_DN3035_c0_g2_i2.p3  ORF type:complete len:104 (-),score=1.91 TRINITY_DN3035_c0_g2_i2:23-334(-)